MLPINARNAMKCAWESLTLRYSLALSKQQKKAIETKAAARLAMKFIISSALAFAWQSFLPTLPTCCLVDWYEIHRCHVVPCSYVMLYVDVLSTPYGSFSILITLDIMPMQGRRYIFPPMAEDKTQENRSHPQSRLIMTMDRENIDFS